MNTNDPRHQQYLEPIIRFAYNDVKLLLSGEYPEAHKTHRLGLLELLLRNCVAKLDEVNAKEYGDNKEGLAQAVARIDMDSGLTNAKIIERIKEEVELMPLPIFLQGKTELPPNTY